MFDMVEETLLPVADAAVRLGVTAGRVRQLVASGELGARRFGRILLVDVESIERREQLGTAEGRRYSPQRAWGLLFLLDGLDAPWLDRVSRSKLRNLIARHDLASLRPRLVTRARCRRFRAHPSELGAIRHEPGLMRTGVSAAYEVGAQLIPGEEFDAYLTADHLDALVDRYKLRDSPEPNVTLRVLPTLTPGWPTRPVAPASAVAIDLADDTEPRAQEAAARLFARYGSPPSIVSLTS
jgi:excisionase family DNA binding protein